MSKLVKFDLLKLLTIVKINLGFKQSSLVEMQAKEKHGEYKKVDKKHI